MLKYISYLADRNTNTLLPNWIHKYYSKITECNGGIKRIGKRLMNEEQFY